RASSKSFAVTPPAECVAQAKVRLRHRMSMSGWWSICSATSATRSTTVIALRNDGRAAVRVMPDVSPDQSGTSARFAATSSAESRSAIALNVVVQPGRYGRCANLKPGVGRGCATELLRGNGPHPRPQARSRPSRLAGGAGPAEAAGQLRAGARSRAGVWRNAGRVPRGEHDSWGSGGGAPDAVSG